MLKTSFVPLGREQFAQLRLAKKMVKEEFGEDLVLHDKKVLDQLYVYALNSNNDELFELFNELHQGQAEPDQAKEIVTPIRENIKATKTDKTGEGETKVGDIVNGKRCTGFYRGQPVFAELK